MSRKVSTIDFHVTSECNQECPYCWGPKEIEHPVSTDIALSIVGHVKEVGARRIVFTGGDPLKRSDVSALIRHAREINLEVALSTSGDEMTSKFLDEVDSFVDLISLPLDGSTEVINSRTKKEGHFESVMRVLGWLRDHPGIDVKICTPVSQSNIEDVPRILNLVDNYAKTTRSRVFCNVFQVFPRAMFSVDWKTIVVSDGEFASLRNRLAKSTSLRVNFLDHTTLDDLYILIFPDGELMIPRGKDFVSYGKFLDVRNLDTVLARSGFDSAKHVRHSQMWTRASKDSRSPLS